MRVIIAGSRGICNPTILEDAIRHSSFEKEMSEIVCGCARGVDELGKLYGLQNGIKVSLWKPDWDRYGKSAGIIRNIDMSKHGDALIALWDGKSNGTTHMITCMREAGKPVLTATLIPGKPITYKFLPEDRDKLRHFNMKIYHDLHDTRPIRYQLKRGDIYD